MITISTFASIYSSVYRTCNREKNEHASDCVTAMIKILESEKTTITEKNQAIWVLGQLADKRALPILKSLRTGVSDHNETLGKEISQYELSKAIKWCEDGNITNWMYKSVR